MTVYKSLFIGNREGGIINTITQAEQQGDPVVVVGLGGSGVDAVTALNAKIRKQIRPDNYQQIEDKLETEPVYKSIQKLVIDADKEALDKSNLSSSDILNIQHPSFYAVFAPEKLDALKKDITLQWMNVDYVSKHLPPDSHGAGATRQFGRWLVITQAAIIRNELKEKIGLACEGKDANNLIVHVITSISGGMGAGSFVDVCYIIRDILETEGYAGAKIFGYFILPDVITSKDGIRNNLVKKANNEKNGYAALLEIEHLMNLRDSFGHFCQDYGAFKINTQAKLVDMPHLISATSVNSVLVPNAYEYAINVIGDYIIAYLSKENLAPGTSGITMKGALANIDADIQTIKPSAGYSQNYHIIGSANGEIPTAQAATYLASRLFSMMTISKHEVDDIEIEKFAREVNVTEDTIKIIENQVTQKANYRHISSEMVKQYYDQLVRHKEDNIMPKALINPVERSLSERRSVLLENRRHLEKGIDSLIPQEGATSLPGIIFTKLVDMCKNPDKGPIYAYYMLNKTGADLDHFLDARESFYRAEKERANKQHAYFTEDEPNVKLRLNDCGFRKPSKAKRIEEYTNVLNNIYHWEAERDRFEAMELLMASLRKEVSKINDNYIIRLKTTMDNLLETFEANENYFSLGKGDYSLDGFTHQLVKFSKIKPELDFLLNKLNKKNETEGLLKCLTDNPHIWYSDDEQLLKIDISQYILKKFNTILNRSIENFLRVDLNMQNASNQAFITAIEKQIIIPFVKKSTPIYWTNDPMVSSSVDTVQRNVLSLPNVASMIVEAGENFKNGANNIEVRKSLINDRIYILSTTSGVPIHTYLGLTGYKNTYDKYTGKGIHLFERNINWRDTLTFPYPYSLVNSYTKNADQLLDLYTKAKEAGVLEIDVSKEVARICMKNTIDDYLMDMESLKVNGKANENLANERLKQLNKWVTSEPEKEDLLNKSNNDAYLEDNFLRFYDLQQLTQAELDKVQKVQQAIQDVEKLVNQSNQKLDRQKCFFDTLLVDGFKEDPFSISYVHTKYGMETELVLCDHEMPFSGLSKYYQAFINFLDMDDHLYQELKTNTNKQIKANAVSVLAKINKLLEIYTPTMISMIVDGYDMNAKQDEIRIFYQDFVQYLSKTRTLFSI